MFHKCKSRHVLIFFEGHDRDFLICDDFKVSYSFYYIYACRVDFLKLCILPNLTKITSYLHLALKFWFKRKL